MTDVINLEFLEKISPFYLLLSNDLKILRMGKSMKKLVPLEEGDLFSERFKIQRPFVSESTYEEFKKLANQLIFFNCVHNNEILIRGQFELIESEQNIIFIGSPWFSSMDQLLEHNLKISDFALHDSMIDVLHVLRTADMASNDLKELIKTIEHQKKELKKTTAELNEIALLPKQNPDPILRVSEEGKVLLKNPAAEVIEAFRYDGKIYGGDEIWPIVLPLIHITNNLGLLELQVEHRTFSFFIVWLPEHRYYNIYGRDITIAKENDEKLKTLSLIANNTTNGVIITDPKGKIEWCNQGFENLTGYSFDEIKGLSPGTFLHGKDTNQEALAEMRDAVANLSGFQIEIINYHKNGQPYWVKISGQPIFDEKGNVLHFFSIQENITIEKRSKQLLEQKEEKYRSIITNINLGLLEVDLEETILMVNQGFEQLSGYKKEELIGRKTTDILLNSKTRNLLDSKRRLRNDFISDAYEIEVLNKEGELRFWIISGAPLINDNGQLTGSIGIHLDITDRKMQEKKLEEVLHSLRDANRELNDFAYIVSHDLKAPLRAISTLASWLNTDYKDALDDEGKQHLSLIVQRAERMHSLIEGILRYSRVGEKTEKEMVSSRTLIHKIVDSLAPDHSIQIFLGDYLPDVYYSEVKLQQVFQNLISNAIKFNDKERGEITIQCTEFPEYVQFSVMDNGPGIPLEYQQKVFKIFQTLKARDEYESTGIGLTIVKKIIETHGGSIWVDNDYKLGAKFDFTVPKH